jgi:hypothetical protein
MKPHKWAKEIVAWSEGAEIETQLPNGQWEVVHDSHHLFDNHYEYRIKQQPKVNEFAHIPYWLCCGSLHTHHHYSSCCEAKSGNPERCRFGTVEEHQKRMEKTQPKEPQDVSSTSYLYVYKEPKSDSFGAKPHVFITTEKGLYFGNEPIGKIKLEE